MLYLTAFNENINCPTIGCQEKVSLAKLTNHILNCKEVHDIYENEKTIYLGYLVPHFDDGIFSDDGIYRGIVIKVNGTDDYLLLVVEIKDKIDPNKRRQASKPKN